MAKSETAPPWRRAFLRELARSGSVALAAEKAGIDRTSAYQVRRRNAAFAASWDRAVEHARAELAAVGLAHPRPLPQAGGELSARAVPLPPAGGVRGGRGTLRLRGDECVRASKVGKPCVVRAGPGRWSVAGERAFLAELAASANVRAAARAAGVSKQAAYARRRQWPAFAAAWDAARAEGWLRLEMLLIAAATATLEPEPVLRQAQDERGGEASECEPPEMSVEQALQLWFHRPGARDGAGGGRGRGHAWRRQEPDIEEVRASILRKIEAIERADSAKGGAQREG
jgi:hypothetical protein